MPVDARALYVLQVLKDLHPGNWAYGHSGDHHIFDLKESMGIVLKSDFSEIFLATTDYKYENTIFDAIVLDLQDHEQVKQSLRTVINSLMVSEA